MTVDELKSTWPELVFIKTKFKITCQEEVKEENFIIESDTPELVKGKSVLVTISVTEFPKLCSMLTAMELGCWVIGFCEEAGIEMTSDNFMALFRNVEKGCKPEEVENPLIKDRLKQEGWSKI